MLIPTNTDRIVELDPAIRCRRRIKLMHAKLFERLPVLTTTLVYTSGAFTFSLRSACCCSGISGTRYGIIML